VGEKHELTHRPLDLDARLHANERDEPAVGGVALNLHGLQVDAPGKPKHDSAAGAKAQTEADRQQGQGQQHRDREDGDEAEVGHVAKLDARQTPHPERHGGKRQERGDEQR
jgi:hypothetical protein